MQTGVNQKDQSDAALLAQINSKQSTSLEQLYRRHAQAIYAFVYRRTCDAAIANEAVNDTFLQLWQGTTMFAGQSTVRTWLLGIAKYKMLDLLRARGRAWEREEVLSDEEAGSLATDAPSSYTQLLAKQQREHLQVCMDELSAAQNACIHLHFIEGLTLAQIAQVLDIPANTAATRVHHARKKLRTCMECAFGHGEVL
jgi:RNA polymerase sigma-70 factor, ECF subfamily